MSGILIPTTSEEAWLEARRLGVTASEIAVILGLSPYSSPFELYYRKRGDLPGQPDNDAMAIGRAMENFVADQFDRRHPEFWLVGAGRELYRHPEREWQMATPDRVAFERQLCASCDADLPMGCTYETEREGREPVAVVECKVDNGDGFGDEGTDEIPVHYRCQVLWQMDVLGVSTGYLAALIWHRRQVRVYELTMDIHAAGDLALMRHEAQMFLKRIENNDPPEPDWRPATGHALKRLHPDLEDRDVVIGKQLVISYRSACKALKKAEQRKALAENRIRVLLGSGRRAIAPRFYDTEPVDVVARREVYDLPAKTIERKASTVNRLVAVKEKP